MIVPNQLFKIFMSETTVFLLIWLLLDYLQCWCNNFAFGQISWS